MRRYSAKQLLLRARNWLILEPSFYSLAHEGEGWGEGES